MLIDLSMKLENNFPVYEGDPPVHITQTTTVADGGYQLHALSLGTHTGTHLDAPAHMLAGGDSLDAIPLERFIGPAKLIEGYDLQAVQVAGLQAGDVAIFYTGSSERFGDPAYFTDYPAMDTAVAEYLVAAGVKLVGFDTCSADNGDDFAVHKTLLGAGIPIIENLTNLAGLRGKDFRIIALPLRIDADGAPARVIAEVAP